MRRLLVTANVVPSQPILVTLKMKALRLFEMSVFTRVTRRNIRKYGILFIRQMFTLRVFCMFHLDTFCRTNFMGIATPMRIILCSLNHTLS
jgi:hypothetical protein